MARLHLSETHINWLRAGYRRWRIPELTERFNARFGRGLDAAQIKNLLSRRGILSGRLPGLRAGERPAQVWRPEVLAWLRRNRARLPIGEVTRQLNERFGLSVSRSGASNACKKFGIPAGGDGRFQPGQEPWNKGISFDCGGRSAETRFQPGSRPHTWQPIGSYRQDGEGYWWLKWRDEQTAGRSRFNWIEVHRMTYRDHVGPIPRGHAIVFLDADQDNCLDPANLVAVSRAVLIRLNQMGWSAVRDPDERRALIALAQVQTRTHERAREAGMDRSERRRVIPRLERMEAGAAS